MADHGRDVVGVSVRQMVGLPVWRRCAISASCVVLMGHGIKSAPISFSRSKT